MQTRQSYLVYSEDRDKTEQWLIAWLQSLCEDYINKTQLTQPLKDYPQARFEQYVDQEQQIPYCWVSSTAHKYPQDLAISYLSHQKVQAVLGHEFKFIIYDAIDDFYPDAFGAVAGTLCSSGVLILLLSARSLSNLETAKPSSQRLLRLIQNTPSIQLLNQYKPPPKISINQYLANTSLLGTVTKPIYRHTNDQEKTVTAITKVLKGHRRRPLVISADRGRGKSAALGMTVKRLVANKLLANNAVIYITAPNRSAVDSVFKHAENIKQLKFIAPDELLKKKPELALLLIDEAAAIPSPLLIQLLLHYSRIVFSTTLHGYEGTGRGFEIRFQKVLDQHTPEWNAIHLDTPIRWKQGDLLEKFVYQLLLLNVQQVPIPTILLETDLEIENLSIRQIQQDSLVYHEGKLQQIFGLLVSAHYQTKPADLYYLLDHPNVSIFVIEYQQRVIATALTAYEGGFDNTLAEQVYAGQRRLKGHLIPQSLAFHAGLKDALHLHSERIIRIAVHSEYQRQGLATRLIQFIQKTQQHPVDTLSQNANQRDYLSVSFAASANMIQFWQKQGFTTVRLGLRRDASSGTHSLMALLALSKEGERLLQSAQQQFQITLPHLLSEPLSQLEPHIIVPLLQGNISTIQASDETYAETIYLETWQWQELDAFINTYREYESCIASLWEWLIQSINLAEFSSLAVEQQNLLIAKILQKQAWTQIVKQYQFSGKKSAIQALKQSVKQLMQEQPNYK